MRLPSHVLLAAAVCAVPLLSAGMVTYYEEALPNTMNPLFATSMVDRRTHELVFDRLFYRSAITSEIKSRIVKSADVVDGGRRVELQLRPGVKWHDEQPLTGFDVCFTVSVMKDPNTPSLMAKAYQDVIADCEASRGGATITLAKPFYNAKERLGFPVLPRHVFGGSTTVRPDHEFSVRPVGTGPMKGSKGRREVRLTAVANAHHRPGVDVMALGEGGDPLVAVRTLTNGGVHGVVTVGPGYRRDVSVTDDVALKSYDLRSWWFVALNTRRGPLRNKAIRKAVDRTIDRAELRRLTMGYDPSDIQQPCQFVSGPFVPSSPYYNRSVPVEPRADLPLATELMEQAGARKGAGGWTLQGRPLVLKIGMHGPLNQEARDLLNQIGNQLQAGGFGRSVHNISSDEWSRSAVTGRMRDYDMLIGKWSFGVVEDVAPLFETRASGRGSLNIFNYSNPAVDALVARHQAAVTDTEAQDAYHELHALLSEELPYLFLWKLDAKSAWRMEVRGNTITPYYYFTEFDGWRLEP